MEYTAESYQEPREPARSRTSVGLWFAVLAGPIAWVISLNLEYSLIQASCMEQSFLQMHLVSVATLAFAMYGAYVGLQEWRAVGGGWPTEHGSIIARRRFTSALGLLNSGMFSTVIFGQWMANVFLNPCMGI